MYPIVTKNNFNNFAKKHIVNSYYPNLKDLDPPSNLEEFKEATKNLYGIELTVKCCAYPHPNDNSDKYCCSYEIIEDFDYYYNSPIYNLWDNKLGQYDGLKALLNFTFGELSCGGIARAHYGSTKCNKETWERIKNWDKNNDAKVMKEFLEQRQSIYDATGYDILYR